MVIFQFQDTSAELYHLDIESLAKMIAGPCFLFLVFSLELYDTCLRIPTDKFPAFAGSSPVCSAERWS